MQLDESQWRPSRWFPVVAGALMCQGCPDVLQAQSFAPYAEFQAMSAQQLAGAQVKFTCVADEFSNYLTHVVVTTGHTPNLAVFHPYYRAGFGGHYSGDFTTLVVTTISASQMKSIVDNIGTVPSVVDGDVDTDGYLSFSIHNVVGGVTKVFEAIVNKTNGRLLFEKVLGVFGEAEAARAELGNLACSLGMLPGNTPTDVTGQVSIQVRGTRLDRRTGLYVSTVRVTNSSQQAIVSPLTLVLLPDGNVSLANRDGVTCMIEPRGMAFLNILPVGVLPPGASIEPMLRFENPDGEPIKLVQRRVYSGAGTR